MNSPIVITKPTFQKAWAEAVLALSNHNWDAWNLVVQITDPTTFDLIVHKDMKHFCFRYCLRKRYNLFPTDTNIQEAKK